MSSRDILSIRRCALQPVKQTAAPATRTGRAEIARTPLIGSFSGFTGLSASRVKTASKHNPITSAISVLRIDGKLPLEPGYALHGN